MCSSQELDGSAGSDVAQDIEFLEEVSMDEDSESDEENEVEWDSSDSDDSDLDVHNCHEDGYDSP